YTRRRIFDIAREEKVNRGAEEVCILLEKRSLLREKYREALVHRNLRVVGLHLAEVRVRGYVQNEIVVQKKFAVEPDLPSQRGLRKMRIERSAIVKRAGGPQYRIRDNLHVFARGNSLHPLKRRLLLQTSILGHGNVRPKRVLALACDASIQDDSPRLLCDIGEAQAVKRNCHEHDVSFVRYLSAGIPNRVEGRIHVPAGLIEGLLGPHCVPLHAQRGGLKHVSAPPVAERVKHDLDLIIVINIFPARKASANLSGVIEAHEDDVKILLVVSQVSGCWFGNRATILRVALDEARDRLHFQSYFPMRLHAQKIL